MNLAHYELSNMATALQQAQKLERERSAYFDSLYDEIRITSIPFGCYITGERQGSTDTEAQALEIIYMKDAYDKRIVKLYSKWREWRLFLKRFNYKESQLLYRYFIEGDLIPDKTIDRILKKASLMMDDIDSLQGTQKDRAAERQQQRREYFEGGERYDNDMQQDKKIPTRKIQSPGRQYSSRQRECHLIR